MANILSIQWERITVAHFGPYLITNKISSIRYLLMNCWINNSYWVYGEEIDDFQTEGDQIRGLHSMKVGRICLWCFILESTQQFMNI